MRPFVRVTAPTAVAEATAAFVFAKVNVVEVTPVIVKVPLKTESTLLTTTDFPTVNPWALEVVSVATFEVSALFVIENDAPRCT